MSKTIERVTHRIPGVEFHPAVTHADRRGDFTEIFREEWPLSVHPIQWNIVRSAAHVMRGLHVHVRHWDYLMVLEGGMRLGLVDLREQSPTFGLADLIDVDASRLLAVSIPPGVGHAFHFPRPSMHLYTMSEYWCPEEEMGCRWNDAGLGLDWGISADPILSQRDAALPGLSTLLEHMRPFQAGLMPVLDRV